MMRITFVSNYINHHQIPFCEAMIEMLGNEGTFTFVQTEEMESDRKDMGWGSDLPAYVRRSYISPEERAACMRLIDDSEVVIFGGCEDESVISERLEKARLSKDPGYARTHLTIRYSERVYKSGQWKFITPRGLIKKNRDHTRYNRIPVYLLCSGGYVASDFNLFGAYKNKMLKWGYFPRYMEYDPEKLLDEKGKAQGGKKIPCILWTGRMLDWKHPELAIETAKYLKDKDIEFSMDVVGDGPEKENVLRLVKEYGLEENVTVSGFKKPSEVRRMMEKADIYLFTSDRGEGWGAVLNESMNSCCAVVADSMIGAVPFLLTDGYNGSVYESGNKEKLFEKAAELAKDENLRRSMALRANETIRDEWNAEVAAKRLLEVIVSIREGKDLPEYKTGPCSREIPMAERKISKRAAGEI